MYPLPSTARQSQCFFPRIGITTSSRVPLVGGLRSITSDLGRNWCSKFRYPISDRLMADRNAACCQQILNVPQAEGETVVGPNGKSNDQTWKAGE